MDFTCNGVVIEKENKKDDSNILKLYAEKIGAVLDKKEDKGNA